MANETIERSTKTQVKGIPIEKVVGAITLFSSARCLVGIVRVAIHSRLTRMGCKLKLNDDSDGFFEVEEL